MKYEPLQLPVLGMNRKVPATQLPPGFWRTVVNSDLFRGKFRRSKGSTQLHTPDADGIPAGCTIFDFLELHEDEHSQDKMLLLLETNDMTRLYVKTRADGSSYGDFVYRQWTGTLATWSDNLLGETLPYPRILRVPMGARIIPSDADAEAQILYYHQFDTDYRLWAKTQMPLTFGTDRHIFTEARLIEPREIPFSELDLHVDGDFGSNGNLGPYKKYYYAYSLVYEDGQMGLPWRKDSRSKIPDDLKITSAALLDNDNCANAIHVEVDAISSTTPTAVPLRAIGINVWRCFLDNYKNPDTVEILGDFHLLGFASFGATGAIGDYYETGITFDDYALNQGGGLKRFDTGTNFKTDVGSRYKGDDVGELGPIHAAVRITAVDGDESDALVGEVYHIEAYDSVADDDIDVYDPNNDLVADTVYSCQIVEGICSYGSDGDFHALILDNLDDISASPEMWSVLGAADGEFTFAAVGKYGSLARGRMVLANCYIDGKHHPARACMSLREAYDTFPSSQQMEFDWDGGEAIVGPMTFTGTGVLVFKQHQVGFFNVDEDDVNVYVAQSEILEEDGLASADSIIKAWNAVFWEGYKGIWMFMEGYGFLKVSDGEYSKTEKPRGGIQEVFDLMDDADKALCVAYYKPDTRKVGFCIPIVNGSKDWDDVLDPITAPSGLNDSYIAFEFDFTGPAWNLADPAMRRARRGVNGELFSTDFTDIDQWMAAYGSEQEANVWLYAESPWMGGMVVKLVGIKAIYQDGPLHISTYRETGLRGPAIVLPDTLEVQKTIKKRLGTGGNPVWLVAESGDEVEVRELHLAGRGLERVVDR